MTPFKVLAQIKLDARVKLFTKLVEVRTGRYPQTDMDLEEWGEQFVTALAGQIAHAFDAAELEAAAAKSEAKRRRFRRA